MSLISKCYIAALLLSVAMVGCTNPPSTEPAPTPTPPAEVQAVSADVAPVVAPKPALGADELKADAPAVRPQRCTFETPLKPGVAGSPGHLIPSKINPNGHSELSWLMREILAELKARRTDHLAGKPMDAAGELHHRIRCAWPTTSSDRSPAIDAMAVHYLSAVDAFNAADPRGPQAFNAMIDGCIACHKETCGGPLAAIRPLRIPLP